MPIAVSLPILFGIFGAFWFIPMMKLQVFVDSKGSPNPVGGLCVCLIFICVSWGIALFTLRNAGWRIEIMNDKIKCKGLFPKDTFEIDYTKSNVGMDYHVQNGNSIWWIYISSGTHPLYKAQNGQTKMNATNIRPGFIKIVYSEAVYDALLEVLPKKQRNGLISARRYAGFSKQGRIL